MLINCWERVRRRTSVFLTYQPVGDQELSRAVAKEMVHFSWQSFLINQLR
jgi:hypothetical protein